MTQSINGNLEFDMEAVAAFCRKWMITELSLFGSVLGEKFRPDSDVDVLVVFETGAPWSYWDWGAMTEQLSEIFERSVDLVEKRSVVNPYRRHDILTTRQVIYRDAA